MGDIHLAPPVIENFLDEAKGGDQWCVSRGPRRRVHQ